MIQNYLIMLMFSERRQVSLDLIMLMFSGRRQVSLDLIMLMFSGRRQVSLDLIMLTEMMMPWPGMAPGRYISSSIRLPQIFFVYTSLSILHYRSFMYTVQYIELEFKILVSLFATFSHLISQR